jgi:hypothetical protein
MAIRITQSPALEPVTLAAAKVHLRVDRSDEDALIEMLISAAREDAENICRRAFVTQKMDLFIDAFPSQNYYGVLPAYEQNEQLSNTYMSVKSQQVRFRGLRIELPFPQLQSVDSVKYKDMDGVLQTLSADDYIVDAASEPGVITPAPGKNWPPTQIITNAVQISFTAGYGQPEAVPANIKAWILMRLGALYENREEVSVAMRVNVNELPFVDRLLDRYRIKSYV